MRKVALVLLGCFLLTLGIGCGKSSAEKTAYVKASNFTLNDINGKQIRLSDYSGKIIILNFFATRCPPCRREMPDFNEIAREYKDDVEVIAVNVGRESPSKLKDFAEQYNLKFNILIDDGKASALYGPIRWIPATFIIDKNFNIARKYTGSRTRQQLAEDIEELLTP
ncbi:MAG: TlpA family protein disulfide reductase [Candidatus Omnitrophica bacterium]|nr:TlpA family protein disulfide reductase [Candidatus Omnitrophota bacterium]